jgi:hypothetical protein
VTTPDAKKFVSHLAKLRVRLRETTQPARVPLPSPPDGFDDLLHELVYSMLLWESTTDHASRSLARLRAAFVDLNELRVCTAQDIERELGIDDSPGVQRAERLRCVLRDIHSRSSAFSLSPLRTMPQRDALALLASYDGMVGFVASRVGLLGLGAHALPVDHRLRDALVRARVVPRAIEPDALARFAERCIDPGECLSTHALLQAWSDMDATLGTARAAPKPSKARTPRSTSPAPRSRKSKENST